MIQLHGIDVSEHNGTIDWDKVKDSGKVDFAMLRMGFGSDIPDQDDKEFERNVKECERVGIRWGAYLYSYALNEKDVQSEIEHAKRLLKGKSPSMPISYDMEDADNYKQKEGMPSGDQLVDFCYTWLDDMEKEGFYVSLYANKSWLNGRLKNSKLDRFDKWVAEWSDSCSYTGEYKMWQFSNSGSIDGIRGNVDLDITLSDFSFIKGLSENSDIGVYLVRSGDTLSKIALKHHMTLAELLDLNPQYKANPNLIFVNQKVKYRK